MKESAPAELGFRLVMHADFIDDLEALAQRSERDCDLADDIFANLQELADSPVELSNLLHEKAVFGSGLSVEFEARELQRLRVQFPGTWRLKLLDDARAFSGHRIIYAYGWKSRTFHVLGLMYREIDYDFSHPLFRRIFGRYGELGLPDR